ncbi:MULTISPECIES: CocE/NonD family hydrolase [Bacteria]|uniref:CocE/NonD family hydrolase n=1 Tax=Bacteria TaxID=2 RepID=UPI003C7AAC11
MTSLPSRRTVTGLALAAATLAATVLTGTSAFADDEDSPEATPAPVSSSAPAGTPAPTAGSETPATERASTATSAYEPVIVDGQVQATLDPKAITKSEVWIRTNVDTDHDGAPDEIYAVLSVPNVAAGGVTVPTVIAASPYYGGIKAVPQHNPYRELWDPSQPKPTPAFGEWNRPGDSDSPYGTPSGAYWLSRGFAFMAVSTVGTNKSTGCPQMLNREEAEANKAVIQWLTGKDGVTARDATGNPVSSAAWSAGKVAMTGTSYDGALPLLTATTGVEGLEAIAPMAPVSNFYEYYHVAGGMYGPQGYQGEDLDNYVLALLPDDAARARCTPTAQEFVEKEDRASGDYNDFWDERNLLNWAGDVRAATLIGHGQSDLNVRVSQSTDWYRAMRANGVPTKLYLHQYSHINLGSLPAAAGWTRDLNRWFTHYLLGVDNGAQNDSGVRIQAEDRTTWFDDTDFPNVDAGEVTFFPTAGGAGVGALESEVRTGAVETKTIADDSTISLQDLVSAPSSPNRLVYRSAPLATELRLSGEASAALGIALNRPAANITLAIADRSPDGTSRIISRAWTDPQNRTDIRTTETVVPGTSYDLRLGFVPVDYRVQAGHAIELLIASSDTETSLLPPTSTDLTVDTSVTSVTLPVVGASDAVREALGAPGEPAIAVASVSVREGDAQTVTGAGLAPDIDLVLGVDVSGVAPIAVRTDEDGTFSAALPSGSTTAAGTRTVTLTAGRATIATAAFEVIAKETPVTPTPSPSPSGGGKGGSGTLPATGGEIGLAGIAGLLLLGSGAMATALAARRRRDRA